MAKKEREILDRLAALEDLARRHQVDFGRRGDGDRHGHDDRHRHGDRGGRHGHGGHDRGGDGDEKRVIDTVVHLVAERVGEMLREHSRREHQNDDHPQNDDHRRGDERDERRVVELVVDLVSERVEEIVAAELDRRGVGVEGEKNRPAKRSGADAGSS